MSPDLDLDLHPEREAGDADAAQDGLVARHIPPHVVDKVPDGLVGDVGGVVQLHGVDVLPPRAGERERVPDVVEGPVDLLDEIWLDLAGLAVPAAYDFVIFFIGKVALVRRKRGEGLLYLARLPRSRLLLVLLGCNACSPLRIPRSLGKCSTGDETWLILNCEYNSLFYWCFVIDQMYINNTLIL